MKTALTETQVKALQSIARCDFSGIRSATIGALFAAGLVNVTHQTIQESYRPSRYGFTGVRWTRPRIVSNITITDAGRAFLAEVAS